jgi:hypothetical protein
LNVNVSAGSEAAPTSGGPAEPATWPLAVGASSIQGRVEFIGAVPPLVRLHREADPYCARTEMFDPNDGLQAVTGDAGTFRIENVPPGEYTIEA